MKLTAKVKLLPTKEQAEMLLGTLKEANSASDELSAYAFGQQVFRQYDLHKAMYAHLRNNYNLSAQITVRCISKVADAYKLDKETQRTFRPHGAIAYDSRILTYKEESISIWTVGGRIKMPFVAGEHQKRMLVFQKGESDLAYVKGKFYLLATCDIPDTEEEAFDDVLGIDLGIVNIATTSDGETFSGKHIEQTRRRYHAIRSKLQSKGTKSAKRHLKKLSKRQQRFQTNTNHVISKKLVQRAKGTNRSLAMEDLTHIRKRTEKRLRSTQRARHSNWAFNQLRLFVTYKAVGSGVVLHMVDPRNTSRTCYECSHIAQENRRSQSEFKCVACNHTTDADWNAALNIRALVNVPIVASLSA